MYEPLFIVVTNVVVVECYGSCGGGGCHMPSLSVKKIISRVK